MTLLKAAIYIFLTGCLVPVLAEDTYSLRWKPVADYATVQELKMDIEYEGEPMTIGLEAHTKMLKIEDDGAYSMEVVYKANKITVEGSTEEGPDSEPMIFKFDKDGELIEDDEEEEEDSPFSLISYIGNFEPEKPVKVGDSWTQLDEESKVEFKLVGADKIGEEDCWLIEATVKVLGSDRSGEGTGKIWLRKTDFDSIKMEGAFTDVKFSAEDPSVKASFVITMK